MFPVPHLIWEVFEYRTRKWEEGEMVLEPTESCNSVSVDLECRDTIRYTLYCSWEELMECLSEVFEYCSFCLILDIRDVIIYLIHEMHYNLNRENKKKNPRIFS